MKYEVLPDISDLTVPPAKMLLVDYHNKTPLDDFSKWLDSWASDCLDNFFSCNEYLEIVPKGLSKGKALLQMADLLHIPVENTIAAGDAANDYTMLEAAHQARKEGLDVVVGYVEPHARPDTLALLEGLEILPGKEIDYRKEFDLDHALQRRPQLILVDELAHSNAQGCRHTKRYQDVEE